MNFGELFEKVNETHRVIGFGAGTTPLKVGEEPKCPHCGEPFEPESLIKPQIDTSIWMHRPCGGELDIPEEEEVQKTYNRFFASGMPRT